MAHEITFRPYSDISVNHEGNSGNSNRYSLINDINYDDATTYIYKSLSNSGSSSGTVTVGASTYISTFGLKVLDNETNKPSGKVRINSISYVTTRGAFSNSNANTMRDVTYCGVSLENSTYTYSSKRTVTSSSNSFSTYTHNISSQPNTSGRIYNSIDDVVMSVQVITYLYARS